MGEIRIKNEYVHILKDYRESSCLKYYEVDLECNYSPGAKTDVKCRNQSNPIALFKIASILYKKYCITPESLSPTEIKNLNARKLENWNSAKCADGDIEHVCCMHDEKNNKNNCPNFPKELSLYPIAESMSYDKSRILNIKYCQQKQPHTLGAIANKYALSLKDFREAQCSDPKAVMAVCENGDNLDPKCQMPHSFPLAFYSIGAKQYIKICLSAGKK